MPIRLFDYQVEMLERIDAAFGSHRSVMVQMPTGTGKTYLLAAVVEKLLHDSDGQSGQVWIVTHRRELVAQIERTLARFGIATGNEVKVLSIQWLTRHLHDITDAPGLIVIDEAHHALAKTYSAMMNAYPNACKLGMTATPCRLNGKGFTDLFEVLLNSDPINSFIKDGHLSPFDYVSIASHSDEIAKIDGLKKRAADGDYNTAEMCAVLDCRPSIERLYRTIADYAPGKKGIVYAINIDHARHIAEYYQERGLNAQPISSKTPEREREALIEDFAEGRLQILVNVDIFSEGFDCPDVEFIQMARPTRSLAKYLQQVGRGLRVFEGKKCCRLLDNVGLYRLFGLPTDGWNWQAMFRGTECGKGEVSQSRIAFMNILESEAVKAVSDDSETEMVVLTRHEDLQERIELFCLIKKIGGDVGRVTPMQNGWMLPNAYIRKGNPQNLYRKTGERHYGRELLQDTQGIYFTLFARNEGLIKVGKTHPWRKMVDCDLRRNPNATRWMPNNLNKQHNEYIWPPQSLGTDDVRTFNGSYCLVKGNTPVVSAIYKEISKSIDGIRSFKDANGKYGIMSQDGDYYLLWDKAYIELHPHCIAYVKDLKTDVSGRWINLYTMQEFDECPTPFLHGRSWLLKVGDRYFMQRSRAMAGIALIHEDLDAISNTTQYTPSL